MIEKSRLRNLPLPELSLLAITMVWGFTFLVVHFAVPYTGALLLVGLRFLVAGAFAALIAWRSLRGLTRYELGAGIVIGISILFGYGLQTQGLQTIESSVSAFLTALYVPMVPLLQWLVWRKPPAVFSWIGIVFAFAGLVLISGGGLARLELSEGVVVTLIGTFAIACEIMLISYFAPKVDSKRVTVVQLLTVAVFALGAIPLTGTELPAFDWIWVIPVVGLGIASAVIQLVMNWAQRYVSATRATLIYTGEPVFAGILGRIAGERLGPIALVGAALILIGVLVSELGPHLRRKSARLEPAE